MNYTLLTGRILSEPKLTFSSNENNLAICKFILVSENCEHGVDIKEDYFPAICFDNLAVHISKNFEIGTKIFIHGSFRNFFYADADGIKHYENVFLVKNVDLEVDTNETNKKKNEIRKQLKDVSENGFLYMQEKGYAFVDSDEFEKVPLWN